MTYLAGETSPSPHALMAVCQALTDVVSTLPGMTTVEGLPQEQLQGFPNLMVYPVSGRWKPGSSSGFTEKPMRWGVHTIRILVTVPRVDLPRDMAALMPFVDTAPQAILHGYTLNHLNETVVYLGEAGSKGGWPITYAVSQNEWAMNTLSVRLDVIVSVEEEIN